MPEVDIVTMTIAQLGSNRKSMEKCQHFTTLYSYHFQVIYRFCCLEVFATHILIIIA